MFHQEHSASLSINIESGRWKCHTTHCPGHKGGGYKRFAQLQDGKIPGAAVATANIDAALVEAHHKVLLGSSVMLDLLKNKRGLTDETISHFKLGYDADRVWIPVKDAEGNYVNVRKYKPGATKDKMVPFGAGYNKARLYPVENLRQETVVICEGELDALVASQYGFPSVTTTGGADTWTEEFSREFRGKHVFMCFDADAAGVKGANQIAMRLLPFAGSVRVVKLPLSGTKSEKDVTDYFVTLKKTPAEFRQLLEEAVEVTAAVEVNRGPPETAIPIHLSQIGEERFVGQRVEATVLVAGKDLAPFQVPRKIAYGCAMGEKLCDYCGICKNGGQLEISLPEWSPSLLRMVNTPMEKVEHLLAEFADVPGMCRKFDHEVKEYANIESVKAIPEIDFDASRSEYVIRSLFYLGHGLESNHTYKIRAVVMPEPKTQYATALIYSAEASQDSVEKFELNSDLMAALSIFKVQE